MAFDQPPPHLPSDATLELSKRRPHEASKYHELTAVRISDDLTTFVTSLAVTPHLTTVITDLTTVTPDLTTVSSLGLFAAYTDLGSDHWSSTVSYATTAVFLGVWVLSLIVLFAWRVAGMRQRASLICERRPLIVHGQEVVKLSWQEKGERSSDSSEALPITVHNSSAASGSEVSLPVGLRNRKDTTRQVTAKHDIWTAAFYGDTTAVHELLENCDINKPHRRFGTPLQAAAQGGHVTVAKIFLKSGANPNAYGGRFHSPLQAAAYNGELELVELLLAHGADPNAVGGSCGNPFLAAVERGSIEMVRCLINAGADVHQSVGTDGNSL